MPMTFEIGQWLKLGTPCLRYECYISVYSTRSTLNGGT